MPEFIIASLNALKVIYANVPGQGFTVTIFILVVIIFILLYLLIAQKLKYEKIIQDMQFQVRQQKKDEVPGTQESVKETLNPANKKIIEEIKDTTVHLALNKSAAEPAKEDVVELPQKRISHDEFMKELTAAFDPKAAAKEQDIREIIEEKEALQKPDKIISSENPVAYPNNQQEKKFDLPEDSGQYYTVAGEYAEPQPALPSEYRFPEAVTPLHAPYEKASKPSIESGGATIKPPAKKYVFEGTSDNSPDFSPNNSLADSGKKGDKSFFDSRSEVSRFEVKKKLKTIPIEKLAGKYKIAGKYSPYKLSSSQTAEIEKMIPKQFGAYITKSEAKKTAKIESLKIAKMKRELKSHGDIYKEEKKLQFFEDAFGVKRKK